jgi:RNA polymerase sigma-70 factor (ECF subfamily)
MRAMASVDTERVWADLHGRIRAFVGRRVRQPADADDIVQRVFLQVHRSLPTLRDADRLHAWIYQLTRRAIVDHYRLPAHRREVPAGAAVDVAPAAMAGDAEEASAIRELAGCLMPLVADLPAADQEALRLIEVENVSQVDAARQLGVSVSGMKSRVQRARRRLRDVVEACCRIELDRRGGPMAITPRDGGCGGCD